jgi:DNA-directed RNA polymerase specialized sigma subunit
MGRRPAFELSQKEKDILVMRYQPMMDKPGGRGDPISFREIAKVYDMSHQAIVFYVNNALTKLVRIYLTDKVE